MSATQFDNAFLADWNSRFPGEFPIGWQLRSTGRLPWVRFHALPGSKRYAETDAEKGVILDRANTLAEAVLGNGTACWLTTAAYIEVGTAPSSNMELVDEEDDEEMAWTIHAESVTWRTGTYDDLFLEIAEDRARSCWISRTKETIFAPYDGGFDIFPDSIQGVEELKIRFQDWLSDHPRGL